MNETTTWIIAGSAVLLVLLTIVLAAVLNRSGKRKREREEAYRKYRDDRNAALAEAEAEQQARKEAEAAAKETPARLEAPAEEPVEEHVEEPVAEPAEATEEAAPAESETPVPEAGPADDAQVCEEPADTQDEPLTEETAAAEGPAPETEEAPVPSVTESTGSEAPAAPGTEEPAQAEAPEAEEPVPPEAPEAEEPAPPEAAEAEEPAPPEAPEAEEPAVESGCADADQAPEAPAEGSLRPAFPDEADGLLLTKVMEGVVVDAGKTDPAVLKAGEPVSFLSIGRNLFVQQNRRVIGFVRNRGDAAEITGWICRGKGVKALLTASDDGIIAADVALYGSALDAAEARGLTPVRLKGAKDEAAQAILSTLAAGLPCTAELQSRANKGDRWRVTCDAGCIGYLNPEAYTPGQRIVTAGAGPSKKDPALLRAAVYIL